jgi:hypothetical protein
MQVEQQHNQQEAVALADRHTEVQSLMRDIDDRVARFCTMTGANGKSAKKRWRDIKKSAGVVTIRTVPITQEDVDKAARDYFTGNGYDIDDHSWEFEVTTIGKRGSVYMMILVAEEGKEDAELVYQAEASTHQKLYADALDFFRNGSHNDGNI